VTFDEYIGFTREFVLANYPSRRLRGFSLLFQAGDPVNLPMPDEKDSDEEEEYTKLERAIIDTLRGSSARISAKELRSAAKRVASCPHTSFYRALRRLREDKVIDCTAEGYGLMLG
jgi:hypothetical protein